MITMTPGQLWVMVVGLAACAGAAWILLGAAARAAGRRWRKAGAVITGPPRPPAPGVTLHALPCGCVWHYRALQRDPCEWHAAHAAERAEINRLDHQIRHMP